MKQTLFAVICLCFTAFASQAQISAADAFCQAPESVFPLLPFETRLDMVDYYNANLATESANALDGYSRITLLSDSEVEVKMTDASQVQMFMLDAPGGQLIGLITTVAIPALDSSVAFYTAEWEPLKPGQVYAAPKLADWLAVASAADEVEMMAPFMVVSAAYDSSLRQLTLTNNLRSFLGDDSWLMVADYFKPALTYVWNGKRFNLAR